MFISRPKGSTSEAECAQLMVRITTERDREAFTRIYDLFAGKLKSFLLSRGASNAIADELLQAILLQVWEKPHLYNPCSGSLSTWLYRISRNRYIDHLRKNNLSDRHSPAEFVPDEPTVCSDDTPSSEDQQCIRDAIKRLPSRQAQVLYMSFYQGKTHSEIADACEMPLGSVKSSLRLAFEKLRTTMGEGS